MGVRVCEICKEEHDYISGFFTRHLKECHDMTLENYIILTEYDNVPPKCKCGLCDEIPQFFRGEFRSHASGHRNFDFKKKMYIQKYGIPKCPTCDDTIEKWNRGIPNKYCNIKCQPCQWNQYQVNETVKLKYGVDNIFQLESTKIKGRKTNLIKYGSEYASQTDLIKNKIKETNLINYGVEYIFQSEEIKDKIKKSMINKYGYSNASKIPKNRKSSSLRMKKNNPMYDPDIVKKSNDTFMKRIENGDISFYNTKKFKDTKLYYQSSYELDFLNLCENHNILDLVKNGNSFNYLKEEWGNRLLTDFSIGDYEIEIKSTYIMEKQGGIDKVFKKRDSVISNNKKYIFILDKDYSEFVSIFVM